MMLLMLFSTANAVEMVIVKTVSTSAKTFVINKGKPDGVIPGTKAIFTTNNYSLVAKAVQISQNYSLWKVQNNTATVPWIRDQIIMMNKSTETIWALKPDGMLIRFDEEYKVRTQRSLILRTSFVRGMSQSISDAPADDVSRTGYQFDAIYEFQFNDMFSFGAGIRLEQESTAVIGAQFETGRYMLAADLTYYFPKIEMLDNLQVYFGTTFAWGYSNTNLDLYSQSGTASVFPSVRIGANFPLSDWWEVMPEVGFESLRSDETAQDGFTQTLNQTSLKGTIGLRRRL